MGWLVGGILGQVLVKWVLSSTRRPAKAVRKEKACTSDGRTIFLYSLNCITGGRAIDRTILSDEFGSQSVTLLAIRPHPDDESTSTGGMLAYYSARGVRTGVVICTGGEGG